VANGITWTGEVLFTDSSDVGTTGVATLTLTPSVGVSNLPALVAGNPGPPPTLRNVTVNQVSYGTTPPASTWTLVTAGSAGVASVYDLTLYVNSGQAGTSGTFTIAGATDFSGTPTNAYTLVYNSSTSKWAVSAQMVGNLFVPSSYTSASTSGTNSQSTLASLTVPSQPFDWYPVVHGQAVATGTVNTHVDLVCRINNSTTGNQVGYGRGVTGATPPPTTLIPAFGSALSGGYGLVSAGSAATVYFIATQTATTSDAWAVSNSTCAFTVQVQPTLT